MGKASERFPPPRSAWAPPVPPRYTIRLPFLKESLNLRNPWKRNRHTRLRDGGGGDEIGLVGVTKAASWENSTPSIWASLRDQLRYQTLKISSPRPRNPSMSYAAGSMVPQRCHGAVCPQRSPKCSQSRRHEARLFANWLNNSLAALRAKIKIEYILPPGSGPELAQNPSMPLGK